MRRVWFLRPIRALTILSVASACGISSSLGSSSAERPDDGVSGTYDMTQSVVGVSCTPQQLPAPVDAPASKYVVFPRASDTTHVQWVVQNFDPGNSLARVTLGGAGPGALGGFQESPGKMLFSVTHDEWIEGPRAGGFSFFVTEKVLVDFQYTQTAASPGQAAGTSVAALNFDTFTFRDPNGSGAAFTTCRITSSAHGTRISR